MAKKSKSLLIFDLDGVLCHFSQEFKRKTNVRGIYAHGELKASPLYQEKNQAIYARPQLDKITYDMLIRNKSMYDIGVWSSANLQDTELLVKHVFGRFYT